MGADLEGRARELRHAAHRYHSAKEDKDGAEQALYAKARGFVAAEGGLAELAARAVAFGVDELSIANASEEQLQALAALPGARHGRQPMQNVQDSEWRIVETVRVSHVGVTFAARRSYPASADDLAAVRQLWSVPQ